VVVGYTDPYGMFAVERYFGLFGGDIMAAMSSIKPAEIHSFAAVLIDMDGTLIDSTDAIVKHWHK
jgi:hypothetical protein